LANYVPPSKKVGGHVPRVPNQIAPMSTTAVKGQKIEEHVVTDLDIRNDENRYLV